MSKYSKMVESNQKASKEKIDCAIRTIKEMLDKEEQLLVCELVRKTGLSTLNFLVFFADFLDSESHKSGSQNFSF